MIGFSRDLTRGKLLRRYKRFFADVELANGEIVTSHCPNTGSMKTCGEAGDTVYLLAHSNPKRKLRYTWEYTQVKGGFVGINTMRPNQIVYQAIIEDKIRELSGYSEIRREVKYGDNSRIDLLLSRPDGELCYVEIKNVTLLRDGDIWFPDAVTSRGQKHLSELSTLARQGIRAVMLFLVNRPDGFALRIADDIDKEYARRFLAAQQAGVEILAYRVQADLDGMVVAGPVPIADVALDP